MDVVKIKLRIVCLFLCISFSKSLFAVDATLDWKTAQTEHFEIHFASGYEKQASKVASIAEAVHQKLSPIINWQPIEKTHLVISDETDFANGMATPVHFNRSILFLAPPDEATGIEDYTDWLETLILHEYVHILHLDKSHGVAMWLRNIFGRQFLLFPNAYQPSWLIEGLATYYETDMEQGVGRGQSALFRSMMAAELEQGLKPVSQVNLPLRSWPMGSAAYLYGVYFYQFLVDRYGEASVHESIESYSDNVIPFRINSNASAVLDKDISELWIEFEEYLQKHFEVREGSTGEERLTFAGYGTRHFDVAANGDVIYVDNGAFEHAAIKRLKHEGLENVAEVHNGARINYHPHSGILISQVEYCDEYNLNFDLYVLKDGHTRRLTECGRYRWATWDDTGDRIFAVKLVQGDSWLVQLDKEGKLTNVLWKAAPGDVIAHLDHSAKEHAIVAARFSQGRGWDIAEFDLQTAGWRFITQDASIDMYPSYTDDGAIVFSSERSEGFQIYRFTPGTSYLEQMTQVRYAAFSPQQMTHDSPLYFTGYHAGGRDIYKQDKVNGGTRFELEKSLSAETERKDYPALQTVKDYSAIDSMQPRWWLPDLNITDQRTELGFMTSANDALELHRYQFNLRYDTDNEWFTGGLRYAYANRFNLGFERSSQILLDQNGDFAVAREVDDWFAILQSNFPGVESSSALLGGFVLSEARDAHRADGIQPLSDSKDNLFGMALLHRSSKRYVRSISEADGRSIRLIAESSEVVNSDFTGEVYTLDWREFVSLGQQHVLAVRLVQGWGTDQPEVFRLGGEDNDYDLLDLITPVGEPLFSKREYALRGYPEGLTELRGRRMQLASIEWRIPGQLIERGWMSPPVGLSQWSAKLFADSAAAYTDSSPDEYYSSVGVELEADVNLFYGVNTRMRLGFAHGLDEALGENRAYFMLGGSF